MEIVGHSLTLGGCVEQCAARGLSLACVRNSADFASFAAASNGTAAWLGIFDPHSADACSYTPNAPQPAAILTGFTIVANCAVFGSTERPVTVAVPCFDSYSTHVVLQYYFSKGTGAECVCDATRLPNATAAFGALLETERAAAVVLRLASAAPFSIFAVLAVASAFTLVFGAMPGSGEGRFCT